MAGRVTIGSVKLVAITRIAAPCTACRRSHGDVELPEASDPPADLNLGRVTK